MESAISKGGGNASPASAETGEGRVSTARWNPKGLRRSSGPESMGAIPTMNRSAKKRGQGRVGTMATKALSIHLSNQGVCGRHGAEDHVVTPGDLIGCLVCKERGAKAYL